MNDERTGVAEDDLNVETTSYNPLDKIHGILFGRYKKFVSLGFLHTNPDMEPLYDLYKSSRYQRIAGTVGIYAILANLLFMGIDAIGPITLEVKIMRFIVRTPLMISLGIAVRWARQTDSMIWHENFRYTVLLIFAIPIVCLHTIYIVTQEALLVKVGYWTMIWCLNLIVVPGIRRLVPTYGGIYVFNRLVTLIYCLSGLPNTLPPGITDWTIAYQIQAWQHFQFLTAALFSNYLFELGMMKEFYSTVEAHEIHATIETQKQRYIHLQSGPSIAAAIIDYQSAARMASDTTNSSLVESGKTIHATVQRATRSFILCVKVHRDEPPSTSSSTTLTTTNSSPDTSSPPPSPPPPLEEDEEEEEGEGEEIGQGGWEEPMALGSTSTSATNLEDSDMLGEPYGPRLEFLCQEHGIENWRVTGSVDMFFAAPIQNDVLAPALFDIINEDEEDSGKPKETSALVALGEARNRMSVMATIAHTLSKDFPGKLSISIVGGFAINVRYGDREMSGFTCQGPAVDIATHLVHTSERPRCVFHMHSNVLKEFQRAIRSINMDARFDSIKTKIDQNLGKSMLVDLHCGEDEEAEEQREIQERQSNARVSIQVEKDEDDDQLKKTKKKKKLPMLMPLAFALNKNDQLGVVKDASLNRTVTAQYVKDMDAKVKYVKELVSHRQYACYPLIPKWGGFENKHFERAYNRFIARNNRSALQVWMLILMCTGIISIYSDVGFADNQNLVLRLIIRVVLLPFFAVAYGMSYSPLWTKHMQKIMLALALANAIVAGLMSIFGPLISQRTYSVLLKQSVMLPTASFFLNRKSHYLVLLTVLCMIPIIIVVNPIFNTFAEMFLVLGFLFPCGVSLYLRDSLQRNNYCMATLVQSKLLFQASLSKITEGLLQSGAMSKKSSDSPRLRVVQSKRTRAQNAVLGDLGGMDFGSQNDSRITRRMTVRNSTVAQVSTFNVKRIVRSCFCMLFRPTFRDSHLVNQELAELTTAAAKVGIRVILNSDGSLFLLSRPCTSAAEGAEYPTSMVKLVQRKVPSEFRGSLMAMASEIEINEDTLAKSPFDHDYVFAKDGLDDDVGEEDHEALLSEGCANQAPTWSISFGQVVQQCATSLVERNPIMFNIHGNAVDEAVALEDKLKWTKESKRNQTLCGSIALSEEVEAIVKQRITQEVFDVFPAQDVLKDQENSFTRNISCQGWRYAEEVMESLEKKPTTAGLLVWGNILAHRDAETLVAFHNALSGNVTAFSNMWPTPRFKNKTLERLFEDNNDNINRRSIIILGVISAVAHTSFYFLDELSSPFLTTEQKMFFLTFRILAGALPNIFGIVGCVAKKLRPYQAWIFAMVLICNITQLVIYYSLRRAVDPSNFWTTTSTIFAVVANLGIGLRLRMVFTVVFCCTIVLSIFFVTNPYLPVNYAWSYAYTFLITCVVGTLCNLTVELDDRALFIRMEMLIQEKRELFNREAIKLAKGFGKMPAKVLEKYPVHWFKGFNDRELEKKYIAYIATENLASIRLNIFVSVWLAVSFTIGDALLLSEHGELLQSVIAARTVGCVMTFVLAYSLSHVKSVMENWTQTLNVVFSGFMTLSLIFIQFLVSQALNDRNMEYVYGTSSMLVFFFQLIAGHLSIRSMFVTGCIVVIQVVVLLGTSQIVMARNYVTLGIVLFLKASAEEKRARMGFLAVVELSKAKTQASHIARRMSIDSLTGLSIREKKGEFALKQQLRKIHAISIQENKDKAALEEVELMEFDKRVVKVDKREE